MSSASPQHLCNRREPVPVSDALHRIGNARRRVGDRTSLLDDLKLLFVQIVNKHAILGPTQFLWRLSCRMLKARQEQIDACGSIHLSFQQFQPVDLTLCLAVGPRLTKRCGNRVEIGREAARK